MPNFIINLIGSVVIAICAISVRRSSTKVRKIAESMEEMAQKQIEYMNKRDGRTSVEETL